MKKIFTATILSCAILTTTAQTSLERQVVTPMNLSGPRVGVTYLGYAYAKELQDTEMFEQFYGEAKTLYPFITQFGWQFETRIFTLPNGASGLIEFVPMIGGLDQNLVLPNLTIMIGARTPRGFEFGMGPVLNLSGSSVAITAGKNFESWGINFPVNVAVVPSPDGVRSTVIIGFNKKEGF